MVLGVRPVSEAVSVAGARPGADADSEFVEIVPVARAGSVPKTNVTVVALPSGLTLALSVAVVAGHGRGRLRRRGGSGDGWSRCVKLRIAPLVVPAGVGRHHLEVIGGVGGQARQGPRSRPRRSSRRRSTGRWSWSCPMPGVGSVP